MALIGGLQTRPVASGTGRGHLQQVGAPWLRAMGGGPSPWREMSDPYVIGALVTGVVNGAAALLGLAQWLLGRPNLAFWFLARAGVFAGWIYAVASAGFDIAGEGPKDNLAWIYILTPIAVGYFAEQLRVVAAQTVLEQHGYGSATELRESVEIGAVDRETFVAGIANEVVLREVAVIAAGAAVMTFLAWRAWSTG